MRFFRRLLYSSAYVVNIGGAALAYLTPIDVPLVLFGRIFFPLMIAGIVTIDILDRRIQ